MFEHWKKIKKIFPSIRIFSFLTIKDNHRLIAFNRGKIMEILEFTLIIPFIELSSYNNDSIDRYRQFKEV
jgi:hypothetical protein